MIKIEKLQSLVLLLIIFLLSSTVYAQKINQYDGNKKRTGKWMKFYPNKKIRYEGQFQNGKEIGVFKFYDRNSLGTPSIIKNFKADTDSVFTQFFTIKGILQSEGNFIGRQRVGKWTYYFPNKKKMSVENYKAGVLHGELINFYPNGQITEKTIYKDGLKNGPSLKFSSDGDILEEVNYVNNVLEGPAKYYDVKGNLKETGSYKNGKRVGKWEYYLDGEVVTKKKKSTYKKKNKKK
ncbi:MAG: hypothetical protein CMB99_13705 [Flavobacteriaceae bacterium]|nr:hypothetical protein [Flavobacteriaceae bacterium]|tara:strand:+ start:25550 stop:26257 length:708 start_codon:yes stop_codon:yes gene_type:complete